MPAGYAHITLVNELSRKFENNPAFPEDGTTAILDYLKFFELGAVSPDYPYLALTKRDKARPWADAMHYTRTVEMIRAGVRLVQALEGETKRKGLAWLLGYSAHIATDVAIHPVVELKVGTYKGHEREHRHCEMHQDAYIFSRLNLGEIGVSEHLKSGLGRCGDAANDHQLDHDIEGLWRAMLKEVYPAEFAANAPKIHDWHHGFKVIMDDVAEEGVNLVPFARHVAAGLDLVYPAPAEIDSQYTEPLKTPSGRMNYDQVFNYALGEVEWVLLQVANGVLHAGPLVAMTGNWDLDTGRNENQKLVFWS